jgi:aldose 1-epimerase
MGGARRRVLLHTFPDYLSDPSYLGCVVGRVANRIRNGTFTLSDKVYKLIRNNGPNHLHGGMKHFGTVQKLRFTKK